MRDDAIRKVAAQIVVHDMLLETMMVNWLAGMAPEAGEEFLAEYSQMADPEHLEAHHDWLVKVRGKAAKLRSTRLHIQPLRPS